MSINVIHITVAFLFGVMATMVTFKAMDLVRIADICNQTQCERAHILAQFQPTNEEMKGTKK